MRSSFARLFAFSTVMLMAACSTGPYKGAVEKFAATATTAAATADVEMASAVADSREDAVTTGRLQLQGLKWQLDKTTACDALIIPAPARAPEFAGVSDSELVSACNLQQLGKPSNSVVAGFEAELDRANIAKARKITGALGGYADGLTQIVNADDYDALRAATSDMGSSLAKMAALAGPKGVAAGLVIKPAIRIAGEIAIIGLEHRRWRLLREVVPDTNDAVAVLSAELDKAIAALRRARLTAANSVLTSTQLAWNRGVRDPAAAKTASEAVINYRNLARLSQRPLPFSKLAKAHASLNELIAEDATDAQIDAFFSNLGEFEDAAKELQAAIKEIGEN